jgi:hypothetical protein
MAIAAASLVRFSSASEPTDDISTTGGAIAVTSRPELTQFTAAAKLSLTSDGSDVRSATVDYRDATGALLQEVIVLTSAVEKLSTATMSRIERVALSATDVARTVTLKQGTGGTTIGTITPNETTRHIRFRNSASAASQKIRYEKDFWRNGDGALTLLSPSVLLTADPAVKIRIGVATAYGDTVSVANRLTSPAGITFVDDGVAPTMPSGGIAAGSAIGVWIEQTLAINDVAQTSTYTTQLSGQST